MAIKGKRKPRGRPRVAGAPKQFLVPPKVPWIRRTSTKVIAVLLVEIAVFAIVVGLGAASERDRNRDRLEQFGARVETALYGTGAAQQLPTSPLVLPELGQAISTLQSGDGDTKAIEQNAEGWAEATTRAADQIEAVRAEGDLAQARNLLVQGLRVYSGLADTAFAASEVEGRPRETLVTTIGEQLQVAAAIVDSGWGIYQEERRKAGIGSEVSPTAPVPGDPFAPPIPGT